MTIWQGLMERRFVVGVGVQKAATSSLAEFLGTHGVAMHPKKELHAFGNWVQRSSRDDYLAKFGELAQATPGGPKWFGEFSPEYCFHPNALLQLKSFFPDARVILSTRNPIHRMKSAFLHAYGDQLIDTRLSLNEAIELSFRGSMNHWISNLTNYGRYEVLVPMIERVFDPGQLFIFRFEDIGTPAETDSLNQMLGFLDLPADPEAKLKKRNVASYHQDTSLPPPDTSINEYNLERLVALFRPAQQFMQQRGYDASWF